MKLAVKKKNEFRSIQFINCESNSYSSSTEMQLISVKYEPVIIIFEVSTEIGWFFHHDCTESQMLKCCLFCQQWTRWWREVRQVSLSRLRCVSQCFWWMLDWRVSLQIRTALTRPSRTGRGSSTAIRVFCCWRWRHAERDSQPTWIRFTRRTDATSRTSSGEPPSSSSTQWTALLHQYQTRFRSEAIEQTSQTPFLEGHSPAAFSSNPK